MLHNMLRAAGNRGGVPTDGMIAHYTMDNISGSTLVDETGNYDGAIIGATQVLGVVGQALDFSSNPSGFGTTGAVVTHAVLSFPGDFAVSFYCNFDIAKKDRGVFFGNETASEGDIVFFGYYDDLQYIRVGIYSADFNSPSLSIAPGWHHVVIQRVSSNFELYIDAASIATWPASSATIDLSAFGTRSDNTDSSVHSRWAYDLWRYYNRSLDPSEITPLYNEGA